MKKDTQKTAQDHAQQDEPTRKGLRIDKETLRVMNGGSRGPEVNSPSRPSQCPTMCF
jgi:hypothetical protein